MGLGMSAPGLDEVAETALEPSVERESGHPRALVLGQLEVTVAADIHHRPLAATGEMVSLEDQALSLREGKTATADLAVSKAIEVDKGCVAAAGARRVEA
jgi:hypothetical protein